LDEEKMHLVLSALLSNAVKFSPPRTPIQVAVEMREEQAFVRVSDQGIGIPQQDLPYIYDLFFQGSNIGAIGGKGRGMGLKIARDYVSAHQGEIQVATQEGQGSVFTVILPVRGGRGK
jgi:signal transduction histidine kinase